jgi:phosphohistidine phosphatase
MSNKIFIWEETSMKTIYVVRHGKAVSRDLDIPDFERSLVDKGEKNSVKIAQWLKDKGLSADLFISSPANRALETAKIFAKILGFHEKNILLEKSIYDDVNSKSFFNFLKKTEDQYKSVMLFGHEPTISGLVTELVPEFSAGMSKSGVAGIDLPVNKWSEIKPGIGILKLLMSPGKSIKVRIAFSQVVQKRLENQTFQFLESVDQKTTTKIVTTIKKANLEITKKFMDLFLP